MVGLGKTTQLAMAAMPMALWGNTRWRNVSACPPPYAGSLGIERIGQKRDTVYVFNMRYRDSIEDRVHQMSGLPGGRAQLRGVEVGHPGAVPHQPPEAAGRWPRRPRRHDPCGLAPAFGAISMQRPSGPSTNRPATELTAPMVNPASQANIRFQTRVHSRETLAPSFPVTH